MKAWKRVEPTVVHRIGWRTLVTKHFVVPDGQTDEYVTLEKEGQAYAGVIALTPEKRVIIAEQFRVGPEKVMLEIPGGGIEQDESPELAVRRELLEETGYVPGTLLSLGADYKDCKSNAIHYYFLATDCLLSGRQNLDEREFATVKLITIDELLAAGRSSNMTDVGALFLAYEHLQRLNKA